MSEWDASEHKQDLAPETVYRLRYAVPFLYAVSPKSVSVLYLNRGDPVLADADSLRAERTLAVAEIQIP